MNDAPFADRAKILDVARRFVNEEVDSSAWCFLKRRRYEIVLQSGGAERTLRGRLTEMFVRRDGKWLHPGWHLDLTAGPAPSKP